MRRFLAALLFAGTLLRAQDDSAAMNEAVKAYRKYDLDGSIRSYTAALAINPKDTAAYLGRGMAYEAKADSDKSAADKAVADFTQAIALDPKNEKAWYDRGNAEYSRDFFARDKSELKAVDDFTHAIELNPKDAEAWRMRGMAHGALFERDKQLADDNSAIKADAQDADAYNDRAVTYVEMHQPEKALADYGTAIQIHPDDSLYEARGLIYQQRKDYSHALADFSQGTQIQAYDSATYESLANLLATCPDPKFRDGKKAVAIATRAYAISHEHSPQALEALAAAYAETGDFDNAVKWQTKYLATLEIPPGQDSRMKLYLAHKPYRDDGTDSDN